MTRVATSAGDKSDRAVGSARLGAPLINKHLPPHLREVCALLASGLLRLHSHTIGEIEPELRNDGESSLHFSAHQSVSANRNSRRAT